MNIEQYCSLQAMHFYTFKQPGDTSFLQDDIFAYIALLFYYSGMLSMTPTGCTELLQTPMYSPHRQVMFVYDCVCIYKTCSKTFSNTKCTHSDLVHFGSENSESFGKFETLKSKMQATTKFSRLWEPETRQSTCGKQKSDSWR